VNGTIPLGEHAVVTQEGPGEAAALRYLDPAYVSSGSIASVRRCLRHVRSTSNNCRDDAVPRTAEKCQIQTWQAPRFLLTLADDFSGWM
jgi:hypothetical protein